MKNNFFTKFSTLGFVWALILTLWVGQSIQAQSPTPIGCTGGPSSTADSNISSLTLVGESSTINFTGCPGVTGVNNQTALVADLLPGETYTISMTLSSCSSFQYSGSGGVWIDFNGDGSLSSDELIVSGTKTNTAVTLTQAFTVPVSAPAGLVTLRAVQIEFGSNPPNPCASYSWGSTIDFGVQILSSGEPEEEDPCVLVMPNNLLFNLDAGQCGRVVSYTVGLLGDCPQITGIIQEEFSGPYGQSSALTINDVIPNPAVNLSGVNFGNLPNQLNLFTPNPNQFPVPPNNWYTTQFVQWEVVQSGTISFDWNYNYTNGDGSPGTNFAPAGIYVGPQIVAATPLAQIVAQQLSVNGNPNTNPALWNQSGSATVNVSQGQWVGFWVRTLSAFTDWSSLTIENFQISGLVDNFPVLVSGPDSGDFLEAGSYESCWAVFDDNGETLDERCFNINILPYSGPVNPNLSCNNLINVSLGFANGECRTVLGADDILEGGPYRCYDDYIVTITYPQIPGINSYAEGNIVDFSHVGLTLTVMVTDPITGNRCWGQIKVEDKLPPVLECGDELTFPCTSDYAENRDPRGGRIVFPSGLTWGSPATSPIRVTPNFFLNDAINNRRFLVEAGVIDCSEVVLTYSDQEFLLGCNGPDGIWRRVIRTWVARDAFHNTSTCQQVINFERMNIDDAIAMSGVSEPILNLQPCTPDFQLPSFDFQGACNIWAGIKHEMRLPMCNDAEHSFKLFRTYTFFDDCSNETRNIDQLIVVKDEIAPVFTRCENGFLPARLVNTNSFNCKADVTLIPPVVTDNCSSNLTIVPSLLGAQLIQIGGSYVATLDIGGPYEVIWTATDECGNQSICRELLTIRDARPPVAVCIQNTVVTLTGGQGAGGSDGTARVYATSIDNGSWDNCAIFDYKVMRMSNTTRSFCGQSHNTSENPPLGSTFNPAQPNAPFWRDYVEFCCDDLNATEPVMVVLRVRDIYGNVNYCMVNVEVQTKVPPVVTAPANVTIECRDILTEEDLRADLLNREVSLAKGYGWGTVTGVCSEEPRVSVNINLTDCGVTAPGFRVVRRFTAGTGTNTRIAEQEFFIVNSDPFKILNVQPGGVHNRIDDVVWPVDLDLPTCKDAFDVEALKIRFNEVGKLFSDFPETNMNTRPRSMPFLRDVACSRPGVGHDDWEFELEGGCLQIIRQWKVIDWCQIDPATGTFKQWKYDQVIKVLDSDPAEFTQVVISLGNAGGSGSVESITNGCPSGLISLEQVADNCAPILNFSLTASDDCANLQKILYTYRLTVGSSAGAFVSTGTEVSGNGNLSANGEFGWNFGAFGPEFQNVVHRIRWTLDDRCGNISTCTFDFIVRDGKKPSPICTDEIIAVLMPTSGQIAVQASLFNVGSFDNCGGDLKYTFGAPFGNPGALEARVFDCDDFVDNFDNVTGTSVLTLPIFVTDAAGNSDFCTVRLSLQDNEEVCGDISSVIVSGLLTTENETGINNVEVSGIMGSQGALTITSDMEGQYAISMPRALGGVDYVIAPSKKEGLLNGVTTLDIVLMQQHILGERPLTSPYARIAADVNADGRINSLDIVELRQVVLLKKDGFSGSNAGLSWKFVDANYVFTTSTPEGENYATTVTIDGSKNNYGVDFVGVKLGDVNGSADAKSLGITEDRSGRALMGLEVADVELTAGMEYAIAFRSSEMSDVMGYQYALAYGKGLEVKGIEGMGQVVSANNYGIFADKNLVTMSWNGQTAGEDLFVVHVKANETVKLSDALSLSMNPAHPVAEAYTVGGEVKGLELRFNGVSTSVLGYALNQNEPNPFKTETKISFQLPSEMRAKVSISDVSGRVLRTYEGVYPAGLNELFVKRSEVGAAGVLYYTLETEDYRASKKMIIIE
jgi:hypothetical protein